MADLPTTGRTALMHVEQLLADAARVIDDTRGALHPLRRLTRAEREEMRRRLAGVIGGCETVRIWLDGGARHG